MILEQQASARIYQFPVGGRAGQRGWTDAQRPSMSDKAMPQGGALGGGESWYHAEAIRAAQQAAT